MPPQLYSSQGSPIRLGAKLGEGGEGTVLELADRGDLVAKLYHAATAPQKAAKLAAMVALKTERLLKLSAWPVDTLHERPGGAIKGFLMPKVEGHKDIHILYGVKSRHAEYPEARWPFLIQAAANVARVFNVIHEHGHVIGDVNHGGVVVSKSATVTLVDCDSFQISANGHRYLCEVGVPTHTPPELQGQPFTGVIRTTEHDAFGLAVIIFQLLFMGRHPFSGAFLGRGEMPLEKAIQEYRFAYGPGAASRQMKQPPGTLALEAVSRQVAGLFERAFLPGSGRPRAGEWIAPLGELSASLKQCTQNSGHNYLKSLASCPWCEIETRSGIVVFFPLYVAGVATAGGAFNVTAVWAQITAIQPPGPPPPLPVKSSVNVMASVKATQIKSGRVRRSILASVVLAAVCVILLALPLGGGSTFFLILMAGVAALSFAKNSDSGPVREFQAAKDEAGRRWHDVEQRWRNLGESQRFHALKQDLQAKKDEYQNLPNVRQRKLQQLEKEVYARQLERFLDGHRIDQASISGIGHARKITLRSYGIETAADVTSYAILGVHGFGPTYTSKLLAWRASIERRFVFDPRKGVDPADRQSVEREIGTVRAKLEQHLRSGAAELRRISDQAKASHDAVGATAEAAIKALAQTEADLVASKATATLTPVFAVAGVALLAVFPLKVDFASMRAGLNSPASIPKPIATSQPSPTMSPTPSAEQTAALAKAAYNQGVAHAKASKFSEAAAAYEQAITLKPDFADAHHELGYVRFRMKEFDEAIAALKQARSLRPKYPETHRVLGQVYEAKGSWAEAAKFYGEAAFLQPKHAVTQYNYGRVLKKAGDMDSAIQAMQEAVKLKPDWAAAHYELGLIYLATGDQEMAFEEYNTLNSMNDELARKLYTAIEKSRGNIQ
jgi:DNA-binding helix-hairpin-helix protein with protein kinase domain/Flp pilus assembly protein TadD